MKCREATLAGRRRGGSFNLRIDSNGSLNEPPRPRQTRCLRAIFFTARPPLLCQGEFSLRIGSFLNSSTSGSLNLGSKLSRNNAARQSFICRDSAQLGGLQRHL